MIAEKGAMHLLYGVSLLCQVASLWVFSRRTSENSVYAKSQNSTSTHSDKYGTVASPSATIPGRFIFVCPYVSMGRVVEQENAHRPKDDGEKPMREVTKVRALLGILAVLVLVAFVAGCGLVPDRGQVRQEAKKKIEAKKQQAKQEVKKEATDLQKKVNAKKQEVRKKVEAGQEDLKKKVEDLKKKVEVAQEDVEKKVDDVQRDVNDLQKKVNELLKKIDAQQQQNQKEKK
jgi:gas vesicle protein